MSLKNHSVFGLLLIMIIILVGSATLILGTISNQNNQKQTTSTRAAELPNSVLAVSSLPAPTIVPGLTCPLFPANNIMNRPVTDLPVNSLSQTYINSLNGAVLDQAFSGIYNGVRKGMPYNIVPNDQRMLGPTEYPIQWIPESDPHPYPVPPNPLIQGPTDSHLIIMQSGACQLYEFWHGTVPPGGATNEVTWDLNSNSYHNPARQPNAGGVTSADAAGLPILPLLLKYDEVEDAIQHGGVVRHALRLILQSGKIRSNTWIWPAYHTDGTGSSTAIPMGSRFRLKASYQIPSSFSPQVQVILQTMKEYGLILADSDSDNQLSIAGTQDARWGDAWEVFQQYFNQVPASNFEVVDESALMVSVDSMAAAASISPTITPVPSATVSPLPSPSVLPSATPTRSPSPIVTPTPIPPTAGITRHPLPFITVPPSPTIVINRVFHANYWNNRTLSGTPVYQANEDISSSIIHDWGYGAPAVGVNADNFSVRWDGSINVVNAGSYQFTVTQDDGVRIWIDGFKVYDKWFDQSIGNPRQFSTSLSAGTHTIKIEYYDHLGRAYINVSWIHM